MRNLLKKALSGLFVGLCIFAGAAIAQNVSNYSEQGGARWVIGGSLDIASGGDLDIESGGTFSIASTTVSATGAELDEAYLSFTLADIQTASSTVYVPMPVAGDISSIRVSIDTAITEGSASDLTFVAYIQDATGKTPITGGEVDVASPISVGDTGTATPTALNTVAAGERIVIESDGASSTTAKAVFTITIDR